MLVGDVFGSARMIQAASETLLPSTQAQASKTLLQWIATF